MLRMWGGFSHKAQGIINVPYFLNTGRAPDWRHLCLHVFGAPCRFALMDGPVHKRAEMTVEGYFVGVQHPMVMIIRKSDMKLISCSKKKIVVYEEAYIKPLSYSPSELGAAVIEGASNVDEPSLTNEPVSSDKENVSGGPNPSHVRSIKSVSSHTIPTPNTTASTLFRTPTTLDESANTQNPNQGEGIVVPEHATYESDLSSGLEKLTEAARTQIAEPGIREKVIKSLQLAKKVIGGEVEPKQLSRGKKRKGNVDATNIIVDKRTRTIKQNDATTGTPKTSVSSNDIVRDCVPESGEGNPDPNHKRREVHPNPKPKGTNSKLNEGNKTNMNPNPNTKQGKGGLKMKFKVGDGVSVKAESFDGNVPGSYSKANPGRHCGVVTRIWADRNLVEIEYLNGSRYKHLLKEIRLEKPKTCAMLIISVIMVECLQKPVDPMDKDHWPRNFFEAIVRPDWRSWVEAVKKEIASWLTFNAYTEIAFADKSPGASIVPLGELYTRKRDESYKFRQYLMGNLLRKGKDFDETFSYCVSWDGIRWSASVACAMSKQIRGLDAVTGFLQAREQYDLYVFLPSHGSYSSMTYEELAVLRMNLLELVKKGGRSHWFEKVCVSS
jgi:hypothetical protein